MDSKKGIIFTGAVVGIIAALLVKLGNPANMGFCIACFIRDISGALGFHRAAVVQYLRPEVMGLIAGAFIMAIVRKEYSVRGGSSPFIRFILGMALMTGALMFLGCPLRMVLRLAGGDLNALLGIAGFATGILLGIFFLNKGFTLKRNYKQSNIEGYAFQGLNIGLIALAITAPAFIFFSEKGPGAMHAPLFISLGAGLVVGILAQRTRLCMVGGIRDLILFKDSYLISGFVAIIVAAFVGNMFFGFFNLGFVSQPIAHSDGLWNFLGMVLCGWASVLLGGCPMRQLVLAGAGNTDSAITVMGMVVGAGICHNFSLAATPKGPSFNGQIAVILFFVILGVISYLNSDRLVSKNEEKEVA